MKFLKSAGGPVHRIKVPREGPQNTTNPTLKEEFHVVRELEHPQKHPTLK